uniref:chromate efflux transporter n=1 Tax=Halomonas sp. TaxID=1486246 RepID=UPI00260F4CE2|nr:chromate efflux transporter [Halomonas sp.]
MTTSSSYSSSREIFRVFLLLGLTSFGGPVAHLGYFRQAFVARRGWLSESSYADLVVLCQFLPGPTSSQVGLSIGLMRGGLKGALAAWLAFTLPSALAMMLFALGASAMGGPLGESLIHGLKLVAVVIVAQAVLGMARSLCPDAIRASIAALAIVLIAMADHIGATVFGQVIAIASGALIGWGLWRNEQQGGDSADKDLQVVFGVPLPSWLPVLSLSLFVVLLAGLPLLTLVSQHLGLGLADAAFRAGALVFGGGHVVLPLLETETVGPGWVTQDAFLAGYGAAQAVPGPLFTFAAYLGTEAGDGSLLLGLVALIAIFLPGSLLVIGLLPLWQQLRTRRGLQAAMHGANAAVVGLLGAALYDPVWKTAVTSMSDLSIVVIGFVMLVAWRLPPWTVVLLCLGIALVQGLI